MAMLIGVTAGILATALGVIAASIWHANWAAVAAMATLFSGVATFAAVLVALQPIREGERRRHGQARILRMQFLNHLTLLHEGLEVMQAGKQTTPDAYPHVMRDIQVFEALFPQAHVLEPADYDAVAVLLPNLTRIQRIGSDVVQRGKAVTDVLAEIERVIKQLDHELLHAPVPATEQAPANQAQP
jgi:hypothetical protein